MEEQLVVSEFNLLDKLLKVLFNIINLGLNDDRHKIDLDNIIDRLVNEIVRLDDVDKIKMYLTKLVILPFQLRDIRSKYGEGQRKLSFWTFIKMHSILPQTMEELLGYFPCIGCWKDLNSIYRLVFSTNYHYRERLLNNIIGIWVFNLQLEETQLNNRGVEFSLLCKWIPKQKCSLDKDTKVVNRIVKAYYPFLYKKNKFKALKRWRHLVSNINRIINTTEVKMCNKQFSNINFKDVPLKCLHKNKRAWLDETVNGKRKHLLLLDRTIGRHNYLDYVNSSNNRNIFLNVIDKVDTDYHNLSLLDKLDNKYFNKYKHVVNNISEIDYLISVITCNK